MKKSLVIAALMAMALTAFAGQDQQHSKKKQDKSTHHAAMHAEHWVDHHASAPHRSKKASKRIAKRNKKAVNSVHNNAMHAEHWVDHHVSAPHKKVPPKNNR